MTALQLAAVAAVVLAAAVAGLGRWLSRSRERTTAEAPTYEPRHARGGRET